MRRKKLLFYIFCYYLLIRPKLIILLRNKISRSRNYRSKYRFFSKFSWKMDIFHSQNRYNELIEPFRFVLAIKGHQKISGIVSKFFIKILGVKLQNYILRSYFRFLFRWNCFKPINKYTKMISLKSSTKKVAITFFEKKNFLGST